MARKKKTNQDDTNKRIKEHSEERSEFSSFDEENMDRMTNSTLSTMSNITDIFSKKKIPNMLEDSPSNSTITMSHDVAKVIAQSIESNDESDDEDDKVVGRIEPKKKHGVRDFFLLLFILLFLGGTVFLCLKHQEQLLAYLVNVTEAGKTAPAEKISKDSNLGLDSISDSDELDLNLLNPEFYEDSGIGTEEKTKERQKEEKQIEEGEEQAEQPIQVDEQEDAIGLTDIEEEVEDIQEQVPTEEIEEKQVEQEEVEIVEEKVEDVAEEKVEEKVEDAPVKEVIEEEPQEEVGQAEESQLAKELSLLAMQLQDIEEGKEVDIEIDEEAPFENEADETQVSKKNSTKDKIEDVDTLELKIQLLMKNLGRTESEAILLSGLIQAQCERYNLPATLVTSLIAVESSFKADFVSKDGKVGLMQISPEQLNDIISLSKGKISKGKLTDPNYNLKAGLWYLNYLKVKLGNDNKKAIIAKVMGLKKFEALSKTKAQFSPATINYLNDISVVYNLLTKNLVVASGKQSTKNEKAKEIVEAKPKAEVKKPEVVEEELPKVENKEVPADNLESTKTNTTESRLQGKSTEESLQAKKVNFDRKLAVKNILLAKDLAGILKWTVVPEDEQANMAQLVTSVAKQHNIDPLFIAAIIMSESSFDSEIVATNGKIGLLQIDPKKAPQMSEIVGIKWRGVEALLEPEYNLSLGVAFLNHCLEAHTGNFEAGMFAYNQGEELKNIKQNEIPVLFTRYLKNIQFYLKSWGGKLPNK